MKVFQTNVAWLLSVRLQSVGMKGTKTRSKRAKTKEKKKKQMNGSESFQVQKTIVIYRN